MVSNKTEDWCSDLNWSTILFSVGVINPCQVAVSHYVCKWCLINKGSISLDAILCQLSKCQTISLNVWRPVGKRQSQCLVKLKVFRGHCALRWMPQDFIWWLVNIDSGNGLVPWGNKPLSEAMLTNLPIWSHWATITYRIHMSYFTISFRATSLVLRQSHSQWSNPDGLDKDRWKPNHNKTQWSMNIVNNHQFGTKPSLVAKILATKFGVFFVIYIMFSKICSIWV